MDRHILKYSLVGIIADCMGDPMMKEFQPSEYEEALFRADRDVARKYKILNRYTVIHSKISVPVHAQDAASYIEQQKVTPIVLNVQSLAGISRVYVNKVQYYRGDNFTVLNENEFFHTWLSNKHVFNYNPRTENDEVVIYYLADINQPDYDDPEFAPDIPSIYEEERIKFSLIWLCEKGMAKNLSPDSLVLQKYARIYKLQGGKKSIEANLTETQSWIQIKPLQYP